MRSEQFVPNTQVPIPSEAILNNQPEVAELEKIKRQRRDSNPLRTAGFFCASIRHCGGVAELADAADSKSAGALLRVGSTPSTATIFL